MLPEILNLSIAENLRETFLQLQGSVSDVTLDASKVETITTPCLQVIVAMGKSLEEADKSLRISEPSDALNSAINDLGLANVFSKWSTE
nr:STAS domain-containing protein [Sneathiella limimaris]